MTEVGKDSSELISFSRLEGTEMGQIVDKDVKGVTENSTRDESSNDNEPPRHVLDQVHDEGLSGNKSNSEPEREDILFHEFLDFRMLFKNHSSSGGVGFVVVHEMEVTEVTLEEGSSVSIWVGKLLWDAGKQGFLACILGSWHTENFLF